METGKKNIFKIKRYAILLLFFIFSFISFHLRDQYQENNIEEIFGNGQKYHRISLCFDENSKLSEANINELRVEITKKLDQGNTNSKSHTYFLDYYLSETPIEIGFNNKYLSLSAYVVGGDFFKFHNFKFLSGCAFSSNDLMQDKVVVSESLAFQLFGSTNVIGKSISINNNFFIIGGVVKDREGFISDIIKRNKQEIFLSYSMIESLKEDNEKNRKNINYYEIVLPEIMNNYAQNSIKDIIEKKLSFRIMDESNRFNFWGINNSFKRLIKGDIRVDSMIYPTWENEKIVLENILFLINLIRFFLLCFLIIDFKRLYNNFR